MGRLLATALLASLCQGCFAMEELDKGQALMDQHSGRVAREKAVARESVRRPAPGSQEVDSNRLAAWTDKAEGWWREAWQRKPPERDPNDIVVRCGLGDGSRFTRKSDCLARGGRIL